MKVRPRQQQVAQVRRLERGGIGLFLGNEEASERRQVRLDGRAIDGRLIARIEELFGLDGQRGNIMPDDADADVVKVVIDEVGDVALLLGQRVALIAAGLRVEKLPAASGRVIDGVLVTGDEVIER